MIPLSFSVPSLFCLALVSLASLQQVSPASLQQVPPPASLQQVSLASLYQVYFKIASLRISERKERTFNENVSTGTMQMQNVIPKIRLDKFSRELKQLDMVVQ